MPLASIRDLASAVRGRRLSLGMSQGRLAREAGVSRDWVNTFEGGKSTVELGHVLRVIDALGLVLRLDHAGAAAPETAAVDLDELLAEYRER